MMKLDPSEEDSDDSGNGGRDSPVGEAGQMTDLEVCYSNVSFWPLSRYAGEIFKTQQCPALLDFCVRKTLAGKSHHYRDIIVFVNTKTQSRRF